MAVATAGDDRCGIVFYDGSIGSEKSMLWKMVHCIGYCGGITQTMAVIYFSSSV